MRLLIAAAALTMFSVPALAAERPPAFPMPPAFPVCDTPGCACDPCTCSPCDCLARAAVLLTVGVAGAPADTEQRIAALEREVAELKAKLALTARAVEPFPKSPAAAPQAAGRFVTRQVCSNGTCRLVQEWVPDVQRAGFVYGDNFIDTDQQPGGEPSGGGGGGCAGGSCAVRGGAFRGGEPVLRVNGGPGLFRSIFGGRCR